MKYDSFDKFLSESKHEDLDLNFIVRWDWKDIVDEEKEIEREKEKEKEIVEITSTPKKRIKRNKETLHVDGNSIPGTLHLYYLQQRKGIFLSCIIQVTRADESKILEFLKPRWDYMKSVWTPFI